MSTNNYSNTPQVVAPFTLLLSEQTDDPRIEIKEVTKDASSLTAKRSCLCSRQVEVVVTAWVVKDLEHISHYCWPCFTAKFATLDSNQALMLTLLLKRVGTLEKQLLLKTMYDETPSIVGEMQSELVELERSLVRIADQTQKLRIRLDTISKRNRGNNNKKKRR